MPTKTITATKFAWTQASAGPCLIERPAYRGAVRIHFGPASPPLDTEAYHSLPGNISEPVGFPSGSNEPAWVRAEAEDVKLIVTEVI